MTDDITHPLTPVELAQLYEIVSIQRSLSTSTGSEQTITLVFRNGHLSFINASNNRKAIPPHAVMDAQYTWRDIDGGDIIRSRIDDKEQQSRSRSSREAQLGDEDTR